ncbi:hypothetical protein, partial [Accumulibacter sp.]|uniref:hypothetical protein n=1 Tax=Accumulibacter sp. TaxID=2053492 RepID=UPI00258739A0
MNGKVAWSCCKQMLNSGESLPAGSVGRRPAFIIGQLVGVIQRQSSGNRVSSRDSASRTVTVWPPTTTGTSNPRLSHERSEILRSRPSHDLGQVLGMVGFDSRTGAADS